MDALIITLVCLAALALTLPWVFGRKKPATAPRPMPDSWKAILERDIPFYQALDLARKAEFESRMMHFLATTRITGVQTSVEEIDHIYIAASAIIPIFGFPDWEYHNLHEVLLYPDAFNHDYQLAGANRSVLGMVGNGPLNNLMLLSQHELRQAFINKTGKSNTAIHEFVHLIDQTDGSIDGIPEYFLDKQYVLPWLKLVKESIENIEQNRSDINPYAMTNEAEFFAVAAEYFFERPELLKSKHPGLYEVMGRIFRYDDFAALGESYGQKRNGNADDAD